MTTKTMDQCFAEGLEAREAGGHSGDNPYCAGSAERREWAAGFAATVEREASEALDLDPNDGNEVRPSGR